MDLVFNNENEFQEYVAHTMERTEKEKTDVILYSNDGLKELNGGKLEGKTRLKKVYLYNFLFSKLYLLYYPFCYENIFLVSGQTPELWSTQK